MHPLSTRPLQCVASNSVHTTVGATGSEIFSIASASFDPSYMSAALGERNGKPQMESRGQKCEYPKKLSNSLTKWIEG